MIGIGPRKGSARSIEGRAVLPGIAPGQWEAFRAMADLYAKALVSERKALWATCRLKGLPVGTPERRRIAELDRLIAEHKASREARKPG